MRQLWKKMTKLRCHICLFLLQLPFNLSNGVTDTLESSSVLIYLETHKGLYTQMVARCRID
jgi:hypothetical protein